MTNSKLDTTYYITYGDDTNPTQKDLTAFIREVMDSTIEESADGRYFISAQRQDVGQAVEHTTVALEDIVLTDEMETHINILIQVLGCSRERAHLVLSAAGYNLEDAIQSYSLDVFDPNKQLTNYVKDVILQNLRATDSRGNYFVVDSVKPNDMGDDSNRISRYIQQVVASNLHTIRDKEFYVQNLPEHSRLMLNESELAKYIHVDEQNYNDDLYYIDYLESSLQKEKNVDYVEELEIKHNKHKDEYQDEHKDEYEYERTQHNDKLFRKQRRVTFEDEIIAKEESYTFPDESISLFHDFHQANIENSLKGLGIGRTPTMGLWYVLPCPSSHITAKPISEEKDLGWDDDVPSKHQCGGSYPDARRDSVYAAIHSRIEGHLSGEQELSNEQLSLLFDIIKNKEDFDSDQYLTTNKELREQMMKLDRMNTLILDTLAESYVKYGEGDFADLSSDATKKILSDAALMLVNNDLFIFTDQEIHEYEPPEDLFTDYRSFILSTINGVNAAAVLHQINEGVQDENQLLHESHEILHSREKLREYVEKHYGGFNSLLFEVDFAVKNTLTIKPEYEIYIRRYGVPNLGLFDAEKLALILQELAGPPSGDHSSSGQSSGDHSFSDQFSDGQHHSHGDICP